jgi:hypothetical protein
MVGLLVLVLVALLGLLVLVLVALLGLLVLVLVALLVLVLHLQMEQHARISFLIPLMQEISFLQEGTPPLQAAMKLQEVQLPNPTGRYLVRQQLPLQRDSPLFRCHDYLLAVDLDRLGVLSYPVPLPLHLFPKDPPRPLPF